MLCYTNYMNTQRKAANSPTVKERKLVQGIAEGKSKRQAAKDAGYTGSNETISVRASTVLKKDNVRELLNQALLRHNITIDRVLAPVDEALTGIKQMVVEGKIMEVEDIDLKLKGHDRAVRLMGLIQPANNGDTTNIFINSSSEQQGIYDL